MADDWVILAGALAAGFAVGALTVLLFSLTKRRPKAAPPPPAPEVVTLEPVEDHGFAVARPAAPPPAARAPPKPAGDSSIPLEWAERAPGPTVAPGRARGVCSGCGTAISVSMRRPVRVACPECGNTRLLS